jgi:2-amino-4-hydroxy-6-hydroxymethyldihydropteridine diphosphokinase
MWGLSSRENELTDTVPVRVWLSLGSNKAPLEHLPLAIDELKALFGKLWLSPVYESEAVGFDGDHFLNLVVGIDTSMTPAALIQQLKGIEARHGRRRSDNKFAPRTLDIDLLTYGAQVIDSETIHLPRDEILRYAFVLLPLSEVAGDELHPQEGKTYHQLWQAFDRPEQQLWRVEVEL